MRITKHMWSIHLYLGGSLDMFGCIPEPVLGRIAVSVSVWHDSQFSINALLQIFKFSIVAYNEYIVGLGMKDDCWI